jgi:hypothetical protein
MKTQSQYATNGTKSNFRNWKFDQKNQIENMRGNLNEKTSKGQNSPKKNSWISYNWVEFCLAY